MRDLTILTAFCLGGAKAASALPNFDLPLDRPFTLRNSSFSVLEREVARQIRSEAPMSFIYPRPCLSEIDSSQVCDDPRGFVFSDTTSQRVLAVSPILGYEYRYLGETVSAFDGGLLVTGGSGPASIYLDARMFTEIHEDPEHPSYDREFVERQDEKASGSVVYSSYSRYRSNLSLDFSWARFTAARDAAHWGPGLFTNLLFNQQSLPFNQVTWRSTLGPVTVMSLYGRLTIAGDSLGGFNTSPDTRSVYGHRYEWRAARNLTLGIGEHLIVYDWEEPFAFVPVVPLFMLKGTGFERRNNGNISGDAAYRIPGLGLLYSEFLIDDLQSPSSLFDDYWGNKWAWMAGFHFVKPLMGGHAGWITEYSRVEPWVYTHYRTGTAQAANGGYPLGNPQGPNSQWIVLKPYFRSEDGWYASTRWDLIWKGTDLGSALEDTGPDEDKPKAFISGVGEPDWECTPYLGWARKSVYLESEISFGRRLRLLGRIQWAY